MSYADVEFAWEVIYINRLKNIHMLLYIIETGELIDYIVESKVIYFERKVQSDCQLASWGSRFLCKNGWNRRVDSG